MAGPGTELAFPGDNTWSTMFRPAERSRAQHTTHRGLDEIEAFARRFVEHGLALDVDDILVNGPPWRTRLCARLTDGTPDGSYENRACVFIEARWGRITRWEDYLDTERVATWDRQMADTAPASPAAAVPAASASGAPAGMAESVRS
jgi:ketosteroid isomerase-like protein